MAAPQAPMLAGVTLPRPTGYTRTPEPVVDERTLADGTQVRYHRGHRNTWELRWSLKSEAVADLIESLGRTRGVTQYVDIDGTPYVVLCGDIDGVEAVAATDPVRYAVGLSIIERRPR